MYYTIRHTTRFRYSTPISESIMEVRIQPRSEGNQYCLDFQLRTSPRSNIMNYRGEFGNRVHHFDIPNSHNQLTIIAEALVDINAPVPLPEALTAQAWDELDALIEDGDYWDTLMPSHFTEPSDLLYELADELNVRRRDDPLTVLRDLNSAIHRTFEYSPKTTRVDSPIDEALSNNSVTDERHVRVAIGRDYADVPPTRGVFRGKAESELAVSVRIAPTELAPTDDFPSEPLNWIPSTEEGDERDQTQQQIVAQPQQ